MQRALFINTSNYQSSLVLKLAKLVVSKQMNQTISLAKHLVLSDPGEEDEDEFLGICESVRDTDVLIVGVPSDWRSRSSMTAFIKRMAEVQGIDNPFRRKKLVLVMPAGASTEIVIDIWSNVAAQFDMDLVEVVTDIDSANRAVQYLFAGTNPPAAMRIVYRLTSD